MKENENGVDGQTHRKLFDKPMPYANDTDENDDQWDFQGSPCDQKHPRSPSMSGGSVPGRDGPAKSSGSNTTRIPTRLVRMWRRTGQCLGCGSEQHRRIDCPMVKPREGVAKVRKHRFVPRKKKAPMKSGAEMNVSAGPMTAEMSPKVNSATPGNKNGKSKTNKRPMSSDCTPKVNRPQPSRHLDLSEKMDYDMRARETCLQKIKNVNEVFCILNGNGRHITKKEFIQLQVKSQDGLVEDLESEFGFWKYSTKYATVAFPCKRSAQNVCERIKSFGFQVQDFKTFKASQKPPRFITGLLQGPTARSTKKRVGLFLKRSVEMHGIPGRCEVASVWTTSLGFPGRAILRLNVDDLAMERLRELDMEMLIGVAGRIKFTECKKSTLDKNDSSPLQAECNMRTQKIRRLEDEIRVLRKRKEIVESKLKRNLH